MCIDEKILPNSTSLSFTKRKIKIKFVHKLENGC